MTTQLHKSFWCKTGEVSPCNAIIIKTRSTYSRYCSAQIHPPSCYTDKFLSERQLRADEACLPRRKQARWILDHISPVASVYWREVFGGRGQRNNLQFFPDSLPNGVYVVWHHRLDFIKFCLIWYLCGFSKSIWDLGSLSLSCRGMKTAASPTWYLVFLRS